MRWRKRGEEGEGEGGEGKVRSPRWREVKEGRGG